MTYSEDLFNFPVTSGRILFSGARDYPEANMGVVRETLLRLDYMDSVIIHGGASGIDSFVDSTARELGFHVAVVDALWNRYGKAAGQIRNMSMIDVLCPHIMFAFPWNGSKGTMGAVSRALGTDSPFPVYVWGAEEKTWIRNK